MTKGNQNDLTVSCAYVAPSVDVFYVICEGVLCASPDRVDQDYDPDNIIGDI